jgi:hypothetical protein
MFQTLQRGMRICSFSAIVDSILMWSHYGLNHTGFCIEYDINGLEANSILRRILHPVIYTEKLFDATKYYLEAVTNKTSFNNLFGLLASIYKGIDWSYEREWRIVLPMGESYPEHDFSMPIPNGIYLGAKISEKDKETLTKIASEKRINVYQMRMSETDFKLTFDTLSEN